MAKASSFECAHTYGLFTWMKSVDFANLGLKIPAVGLGGIVVDPPSATWISKADFRTILSTAVHDLGLRYIDTAKAYGIAEQEIGSWLLDERTLLRDQILIGSKTGAPRNGDVLSKFDTSYIETQVATSLSALNIRQLDIYWMHEPDAHTSLERTVLGFAESVISEKCRAYGLCNISAEQLEKTLEICSAARVPRPAAVQNEFNLLNQADQSQIMDICEENSISFTAFSPLASGMLTGRYKWNQTPAPGSRWDVWSKGREFPKYWSKAGFDAVESFIEMAQDKAVSPAALALSWCFKHPKVNMTLIGPRVPEHLKAVKIAMGMDLTASQFNEIQMLFAGLGQN